MNQILSDDPDFTAEENQLYKQLQAARSEYQNLSYTGELPFIQRNPRRPWIPMSIAASIAMATIIIVSLSSIEPNPAQSQVSTSKFTIPTQLQASTKLTNKHVSLSVNKPAATAKLKVRFSMPMRPVKRSS